MKKWKFILVNSLLAIICIPFSYVFSTSIQDYTHKLAYHSPYESVRLWGRDKLSENTEGLVYVAIYGENYLDNIRALNEIQYFFYPEDYSSRVLPIESRIIFDLLSDKRNVFFLFDRYLEALVAEERGYASAVASLIRETSYINKPTYDIFIEYVDKKLNDPELEDRKKFKLINLVHFCNYNWHVRSPKSPHHEPQRFVDVVVKAQKNNSEIVKEGLETVEQSLRNDLKCAIRRGTH